MTFDHVWRIRLTTPQGGYTSPIVTASEFLPRRDYLYVREMIRQAKKLAKKFTGVEGHLLRRKRYGQPCPTCLDPFTKEPTRSQCPTCDGTGIAQGYHAAFCHPLWAITGLVNTREQIQDGLQGRTDKPSTSVFDLYGFPGIETRDVFVEKHAGRRWFVERIIETAKKRNYVFKVQAEMRLAPLSDVIYTVPLGL